MWNTSYAEWAARGNASSRELEETARQCEHYRALDDEPGGTKQGLLDRLATAGKRIAGHLRRPGANDRETGTATGVLRETH